MASHETTISWVPLMAKVAWAANKILTTMKELHGAIMVPITVGFLAGLIGLFERGCPTT
jgi:hypothetical protein